MKMDFELRMMELELKYQSKHKQQMFIQLVEKMIYLSNFHETNSHIEQHERRGERTERKERERERNKKKRTEKRVGELKMVINAISAHMNWKVVLTADERVYFIY